MTRDANPDDFPLTSDLRRSFGRGLDAGFNRLSEALRCAEDRLRFDLPGAHLAAEFRRLRQSTLALRRRLEEEWGSLLDYRDVATDPGAPSVRPGVDVPRRSVRDVLAANLARAREGARSVEEALRAGAPHLAAVAEQLRYSVYDLEKRALRVSTDAHGRRQALQQAQLYVLLTTHLAARPILETAESTCRGGAQIIQLREKELPNREFLPLARDLRQLTTQYGVLLIINDRVEIAALVQADGVHQGQDDLPPEQARRILGADALVGISTHEPQQAQRAQADGADYIGVGPIFETRTKEHRSAVGLDYVRAAQESVSIPGFAIGSVNSETLPAVLAAGAQRIAVCTGIIAATDIEGTTRWMRSQLPAIESTRPYDATRAPESSS